MSKLIGHGWAIEFLRGQLQHGAVHHAYLFHGGSGIGKRALAEHFAGSLLCQEQTLPACGECDGCRRMGQGTHPDFERIASEGVGQILKIDQVREMQRHIALASYAGGRRVVLLDRANELNQNAANALLKTLEEPPEHVVLLMTANSIESLPLTLVSRCEVLSLRPVASEDMLAGLQGLVGRDKAELVTRLSGGLPGKALALAQDEGELAERKQALDQLLELLGADRVQRFAFVDDWCKGRDLAAIRGKTMVMLVEWLSLLRDVMLEANGANVNLSNPDMADVVAAMRGSLSPEQAAGHTAAVKKCMDAVDENGNVQLALEVLMLDLPLIRLEPNGV